MKKKITIKTASFIPENIISELKMDLSGHELEFNIEHEKQKYYNLISDDIPGLLYIVNSFMLSGGYDIVKHLVLKYVGVLRELNVQKVTKDGPQGNIISNLHLSTKKADDKEITFEFSGQLNDEATHKLFDLIPKIVESQPNHTSEEPVIYIHDKENNSWKLKSIMDAKKYFKEQEGNTMENYNN